MAIAQAARPLFRIHQRAHHPDHIEIGGEICLEIEERQDQVRLQARGSWRYSGLFSETGNKRTARIEKPRRIGGSEHTRRRELLRQLVEQLG